MQFYVTKKKGTKGANGQVISVASQLPQRKLIPVSSTTNLRFSPAPGRILPFFYRVAFSFPLHRLWRLCGKLRGEQQFDRGLGRAKNAKLKIRTKRNFS